MYSIQIDPALYETYPEIRLGCLTFEAQVRPSDPEFWAYLDNTVLPVIRQNIEGKEWSQIPGIRGSRAAYKAFELDAGLLY